jgi:dTDP-4-amino-4,6-dideoxygalactose transaminase
MKIPYFNWSKHYQVIKNDIDIAFKKVMEEGVLLGGKYVNEFEKSFADLIGSKYCVSVGNCTDALFICLKTLDIQKGDEVITVANGWISASESISLTGATPVFVDAEIIHDSIDPVKLEMAINKNTKAIILTHFQGQICDMHLISKIADRRKIPIIEDCAQAHLTGFNGTFAGNFGVASCFSFYPTKNLGALGDAGCILTSNKDFAKRARMFANHGSSTNKYVHEIEGINSRMDTLQAAFLLSQLPYLQQWTAKRREHAQLYQQLLKEVKGIQLPVERPDSQHSFHIYAIKTPFRNELKDYLAIEGVETLIHYPQALPFQKAYHHYGFKKIDFPVAFELQQQNLSLPIHPELEKEEINWICDKIKAFFKSKN